VPGGKATYPSAIIMNTSRASPVLNGSSSHPRSLAKPLVAAALVLDVQGCHCRRRSGDRRARLWNRVHSRVDKVVGPGNAMSNWRNAQFWDSRWMTAGPNELAIVADETRTPRGS
jgi:hypothetical protein